VICYFAKLKYELQKVDRVICQTLFTSREAAGHAMVQVKKVTYGLLIGFWPLLPLCLVISNINKCYLPIPLFSTNYH